MNRAARRAQGGRQAAWVEPFRVEGTVLPFERYETLLEALAPNVRARQGEMPRSADVLMLVLIDGDDDAVLTLAAELDDRDDEEELARVQDELLWALIHDAARVGIDVRPA